MFQPTDNHLRKGQQNGINDTVGSGTECHMGLVFSLLCFSDTDCIPHLFTLHTHSPQTASPLILPHHHTFLPLSFLPPSLPFASPIPSHPIPSLPSFTIQASSPPTRIHLPPILSTLPTPHPSFINHDCCSLILRSYRSKQQFIIKSHFSIPTPFRQVTIALIHPQTLEPLRP